MASAGVDVYDVGRVPPGERVALTFVVRAGSKDAAPTWERLLVSVDPMLGSAHTGDPGAITDGRVVYAAVRAVRRALDALIASA